MYCGRLETERTLSQVNLYHSELQNLSRIVLGSGSCMTCLDSTPKTHDYHKPRASQPRRNLRINYLSTNGSGQSVIRVTHLNKTMPSWLVQSPYVRLPIGCCRIQYMIPSCMHVSGRYHQSAFPRHMERYMFQMKLTLEFC